MSLSAGVVEQISELLDVSYIFFLSLGFKWFCMTTVIILNFFAYYQNPVRFSKSHKWIMYIIAMGAITLYLFSFISLWYQTPFTDKLPDGWYFIFVLLAFLIITEITLSTGTVDKNDDSLNQPPEGIWEIKNRIFLYWIILVFDVMIFLQLYIESTKGKSYSLDKTYLDKFILSKFGGLSDDKMSFVIGWGGFIGLLFDIIAINNITNFKPCDYGMPSSWNY